MQVKLKPVTLSSGLPATMSFPGFQKILDWVASGGETSKSVTIDGDTDKEYIIQVWNKGANTIDITLNGDTGSNYGQQYILNNAGTLSCASSTNSTLFQMGGYDYSTFTILTPAGLLKSGFHSDSRMAAVTGSDVSLQLYAAKVWNNTTSTTSITFTDGGSSYTAGSRIIVYTRRIT